MAGRQRLAFDAHGVGDRKHRVLIRSAAPRARLSVAEPQIRQAVRNQLAPNLATPVFPVGTMYGGAGVVDRNSHRTKELSNGRFLIVSTGREGKAGNLGQYGSCERNQRQSSKQS